MTDNNFYHFETALEEGIIIKRKSQFTIEVEVNGIVMNCHCPTTNRIGDIDLNGLPCLLSTSADKLRKTAYTVEAISLELVTDKEKKWIGINQNAANRYVEYYLKSGKLSILGLDTSVVQREKKLGNSKIDFLIGNTYLEVKTPFTRLQLDIPSYIKRKKMTEFNSFDRFLRHIREISNNLSTGERAILLSCFIYDNPGFKVPSFSSHTEMLTRELKQCIDKGLELWQVNFKIDHTGVSLDRCFELTPSLLNETMFY